MKPFSQVAIPHRDILEGRLTMDVFAADLWKVVKGQAPDEYQNRDVFFMKTYNTAGLKNLLELAEKRLKGSGGDPVIQLQTPFGGGKTHTLIALYHKAKEWNANVVVIDGTALDPKETTIWEEIERQLTKETTLLKGKTAPGRDKLERILLNNQPLLILIDELLQYTTKASGIKVEDSNLASQTLAFMQELEVAVSTANKSMLVITLPSSVLEHYDENAERLFRQLQKITGRVEKIYTPVQDDEVAQVIRRRLFQEIDEITAKKIVENFLNHAERERILPFGKPIYREKFLASYPFQPEVIDVLYKRWGSLSTFQRTRGVLRILALVVHSLIDKNIPFIRLSDFDLENEEIRRELIKHTGSEYESVIYADITSKDSGSKKVDKNLGDAYRAFSFGTKITTTIFLYSFSGGPERGATISDLKLSCADMSTPSSVVSDAIPKLKENLFYLSDEGLYFTNQPNMIRIHLNKMETIEEEELRKEEERLLAKSLKGEYFKIYVWPKKSNDIPDTKELKLVILNDKNLAGDLLENYSNSSRIYRNTIIFLTPLESERGSFNNTLRRKLAWQLIDNDKTLSLTETQKREVKEKLKRADSDIKDGIRNLYRHILIPAREGLKEHNLGISTFGVESTIDKEVYDRLKNEGEIVERISPLILKEQYLANRDYLETRNILESFFKTPGELRVTKEEVLKDAIREGVKQGLFGIGILEDGKPVPRYFKEEVAPDLVDGEVLIKAELCELTPTKELVSEPTIIESKFSIAQTVKEKEEEAVSKKGNYSEIVSLRLNVPMGKLSDMVKIVNYIKSKFAQITVKIYISAKEGEISTSEYEDKIKEAIIQTGIEVEEERLK